MYGELSCRKWLKTAREATISGCPSYIGFKKCAPVDSARILVSGDTGNKKWMQPTHGLRADEIKLWLTPSAKQCRNPCSGLPAVYPDLSTRHDWPVKKGLCFVCHDRQSGWRGIRDALPVIRWIRWGSRTRISALLRRRYYVEFSYRLHAGYPLKAQYLVQQIALLCIVVVLRWLPCRGIGNYKSFKCG